MTTPEDPELTALLAEWKPPPAPASLEAAVYAQAKAQPRWRRWLSAEIRVPLPIGAVGLVVALLLALALAGNRTAPTGDALDVRDFQPVDDLNPRIIRSSHEND